MTVEGVLPGLRFVEALIRSSHDLLENIIDRGAAAVGGNSSSSATSHVAVATAATSVLNLAIFGSQVTAACKGIRDKVHRNISSGRFVGFARRSYVNRDSDVSCLAKG